MAKTTKTEADLGLAPTEEEMAAPALVAEEDDIPQDDDPPVDPPSSEPAKAEPKPAEQAKPAEEPKTVDLRALQEARAEAREARRQSAILEQRWNDYLAGQRTQQQAPPAQPEAEIPRWAQNPVGAGQWTQDRLIALEQKINGWEQGAQQKTTEQQQWDRTLAYANEQFETAKTADPTLQDALDHTRGTVASAYVALGYSRPDAVKMTRDLEHQHIAYAVQNGIPMGDYIRDLATQRGWQPPAAVPPPSSGDMGAPPKRDLAALSAAQQRHQSLSDAGGGHPVDPVDAKALAKMTDKQFRAWMSKKGNEAKFDEMMGKSA